jgi:hypothetical protein
LQALRINFRFAEARQSSSTFGSLNCSVAALLAVTIRALCNGLKANFLDKLAAIGKRLEVV